MGKRWITRAVEFGVKLTMFALVAVVVLGFLVKGLWNWLMPQLFGLHLLTFEQALGLLALSWILFGGFRGPRPGHHWRRRFRERWDDMTPEQRERFRAGLWGHGGRHEAPAEQKN
jgi:Ca2+/H+ antiporter, TMEM165/GDT1 family